MATSWRIIAVLTWLFATESVDCLPRSISTSSSQVTTLATTEPEQVSRTQYPPSNQRIAIQAATPVRLLSRFPAVSPETECHVLDLLCSLGSQRSSIATSVPNPRLEQPIWWSRRAAVAPNHNPTTYHLPQWYIKPHVTRIAVFRHR